MTDVVIKVKDVAKFYKLYKSPGDRLKEALNPLGKLYHKDFYALKNINLEIKKGEILGIVGKNGCGKSTLLKLISGVLEPNEGRVKVSGKISALLELGSGFNPEFTGMQNIFFYGTILGFSKKEMEGRLDNILAFADVGEFIHQPLKTYSSGMKARLGFSVAVHIEPEILILDEVLSVGDSFFQRKCYAKMEEFFDGGKTIIYVSHNLDSVNRLCTRAIFIDNGEIILSSEPATVTKYYQKYIYAAEHNKEKVKNEIIALSSDTTVSSKKLGEISSIKGGINDEIKEMYLPELKPKSTIEYKEYDVDIFDIQINKNKSKVNVLVTGEVYQFEYKVRFNDTYTNVAFGMQIKTEKGQVLSAFNTVDNIKKSVSLRDTYLVKWPFTCLMNAGMFYTNCGVTMHNEGGYVYLNRIVDAAVFKVENNSNQSGGLVSLVQKACLELLK